MKANLFKIAIIATSSLFLISSCATKKNENQCISGDCENKKIEALTSQDIAKQDVKLEKKSEKKGKKSKKGKKAKKAEQK
jgi:hypothetical protein